MFRIGDLVRVKSREEIERTLDDDYSYDGLDYNDDEMSYFCGRVYKIGSIDADCNSPRYCLYPVRFSNYDDYQRSGYEDDDDWVGDFRWVEVWLEPVPITMWEGL